ncbi:hypothetical protein AgCh_023977 [Apium graveolens]
MSELGCFDPVGYNREPGSGRWTRDDLVLKRIWMIVKVPQSKVRAKVLVELNQASRSFMRWKALDFAALKRSLVSYFDDEKQETAISRWDRAKTRASKVGKGLSKSEKAQNGATIVAGILLAYGGVLEPTFSDAPPEIMLSEFDPSEFEFPELSEFSPSELDESEFEFPELSELAPSELDESELEESVLDFNAS